MKTKNDIETNLTDALNVTDTVLLVRPNCKTVDGTLVKTIAKSYSLKTESLDYPFTIDEVITVEKYRRRFDFYVIHLRR